MATILARGRAEVIIPPTFDEELEEFRVGDVVDYIVVENPKSGDMYYKVKKVYDEKFKYCKDKYFGTCFKIISNR